MADIVRNKKFTINGLTAFIEPIPGREWDARIGIQHPDTNMPVFLITDVQARDLRDMLTFLIMGD